MAFGKNPHVVKAQAAEQKAADASDDSARILALREAAHLWERAAEREAPGKRRVEYEGHATRVRALAQGTDPEHSEGDGSAPVDPKDLN